MKAKLVFWIVTIVAMIFISFSSLAQSECDWVKTQKDFDASSLLPTWHKYDTLANLYKIGNPTSNSSKNIVILIKYGEKEFNVTYNYEDEARIIETLGENLEIVIVDKQATLKRSYHYYKGKDLKEIIPYKDTDCFRMKPHESELLLSNPTGDTIYKYDTKKETYYIAKKI